jgi:16S rRNA C1402 (ribose-2'-O) methylase RsmI
LTLPTEKYFRGTVSEILKLVTDKNLKGEFVLLIYNKTKGTI